MAKRVRVTWHGDKFQKRTAKQLEKGVTNACLYTSNQMKKNVNRGNADGSNPSDPGEYPKKVTGTLQNNITYTVKTGSEKIKGRVGIRKSPASEYALYLELGTSKMAARPFIRKTVFENRSEIRKRIGKG